MNLFLNFMSWSIQMPKTKSKNTIAITRTGHTIDTFWKTWFKRIFIVKTEFLILQLPQICNFRLKGQSLHFWQNPRGDPQWSILMNFRAKKWIHETKAYQLVQIKKNTFSVLGTPSLPIFRLLETSRAIWDQKSESREPKIGKLRRGM